MTLDDCEDMAGFNSSPKQPDNTAGNMAGRSHWERLFVFVKTNHTHTTKILSILYIVDIFLKNKKAIKQKSSCLLFTIVLGSLSLPHTTSGIF